MRKKRRNNSLSKKIIAAMLCAFMITVSINPGFVSYVYANSTEIQGVFNETLSEDKTSSVVDLRIDEAEDKTIESVTLPDQTKIVKEDFKHDNNKLLIEYTATENKNLEFIVEYTKKQQEMNVSTENSTSQVEVTPEVKKETLSYEVKDIVAPKNPTLNIEAKDITYKVGEEIDFRKGITIHNENDNDITKDLNFDIVSYGEYKKDTVGTYEISYEVKHPVSAEVFTFVRKIVVEGNEKAFSTSPRDISVNKGEISLSSSNATLTSPDKYDLSDITQNTFNLTVHYAPTNTDSGRRIVISIPENFKIVKAPSLSDFQGASNVTSTSNTLSIIFLDSVSIDTTFEITIARDRDGLYKKASIQTINSQFKMMGYKDSNAEVFTENFELSLEKFTAPNYVIQDKLQPYGIETAGKDTLSFSFTISRDKLSAYDNTLGIVIPKVYDTDGNSISYNNIRITTDYYHGTVYEYDGYYKLLLPSEDKFAYTNKDVKINVTYRFKSKIYSNGYFESPEEIKLLSDFGNYNLGKIIIDTREKQSIKVNKFSTYTLNKRGVGDKDVNISTSDLLIDTDYSRGYLIKDLSVIYEIPYELDLLNVGGGNYSSSCIVYTNLGREIKINSGENIKGYLSENEWINKVIEKLDTSKIGYLPFSQSSGPKFKVNIRDTDQDGNELTEGMQTFIKQTVISSDPNFTTSSKETPIELIKRDFDDFKLTSMYTGTSTRDKIQKKYSDDKDVILTSFSIYPIVIANNPKVIYNPRTQVYKNFRIDIHGEETLALTDKIQFMGRGLDCDVKIVYRTNLVGNEQILDAISGWNRHVVIPLKEDEYITNLYILYDELDLLSSQLDGHNEFEGINLISTNLPEYNPINNDKLDNIYYEQEIAISAENSVNVKTLNGITTPTFKWRDYKSSLICSDLGTQFVDMNSRAYVLGEIKTVGLNSENLFSLKNTNIEITADEKLMSLIDGIRIFQGRSYFPKGATFTFTSNKGNESVTTIKNSDFSYQATSIKGGFSSADEYITKITISAPEYAPQEYNKYAPEQVLIDFTAKRTNVSPVDGTYLGDVGRRYQYVVKVSADNIENKEEMSASSPFISGATKVDYSFTKMNLTQANYSSQIYQGNQFDIVLQPVYNTTLSTIGGFYKTMLTNPIFYVEVDDSYAYVANSIQSIDGFIPKVTFLERKTTDGHSVLKIDMTGYSKEVTYDYPPILKFKMMAKGNANPAKNLTTIYALWTDLNESKVAKQDGTIAKVDVIGEIVDTKNVQNEKNNPLLFVDLQSKFAKNEILPVNEMGIGNLAELDGSVGAIVKGHDNNAYSQQLSLISNYQNPTKDWIVYIPVPKKGKTVTYQENVNGANITKESEPAEYSMSLSEKVNIPGLPADATIEYSMDETPVYALDDSDVGSYQTSITDSELKDVTMIKIKIPTLDARAKLYPVIKYEVYSNKQIVGEQRAFGGVYFNMKIGSSSDFQYGKTGNYSKLVEYVLDDFTVSGKVWEDKNEPSNSIYDSKDAVKPSVGVIATDKDGNEFTAKTKNDGTYSIAVPSHGETELKVVAPNDLAAIPKQKYIFVESGKGTSTTSSIVDKDTGKTTIEFIHDDIYNINAGLYAERAVAVNPEDIVIVKGTTMPVPAVAFPNYSVISYQNTANTDIATVSKDGKVTGVELGETTATVTIPDGKGGNGVVTATYNIKVVPADVPTATSDPITIFQNGSFDATSGIEILDSDKKPINASDTTKVTINTDSVDVTIPGRYPITYIINDGYNEVTVTRYIYVHGNIQLVVPNDVLKKVGESVTALDGASATYIHINEDGTQTVKNVAVTTPNATITSDVAKRMNVPLEATVTVDGATDTATGSYVATFNEKAILTTVKDNITVKVGASLDEIKAVIQASASMMTPGGNTDLTNSIDWSILNGFDTSTAGNTITGKIFVLDPDTGEKVEKEITVTVSQNVVINAAKEVNLVVGDSFDSFANVTIKDGDGNDVTLTNDMIISNNVEVNDGKTTKRGVYEVEYAYTDKYGNTKRAKTTVNVHGQLQFDDTRKDFLQNDSVADINLPDNNKDLAYYIDATGNKKLATLKTVSDASSATIGKSTQNLVYTHPVNGNDNTFVRAIYVHGNVSIQVPNTYTVKVNTEINTLENVTASYKFVEDDGTIVDKTTAVTSVLGNKTASAVPTEKTIPVESQVEVVAGLNSNATNSYTVIFNGLPTITAANDSVEARIGATFDEIKNAINASASVQYGDETNLTDLTVQINWDEVQAIDTSIKDKTYTVKINVWDRDGAKAEKTLHIKISNGIIINLPSVDKVVGDKFDPKENVTIFDGQGKPVDLNDVTIDDSKVDMSKPGNYDVTYTYTDSLGNTETKTNTIRVHGKLQFEGLGRIDLIEKEGTYVVDTAKAFYMNNEGKKVYVDGIYDKAILDQSVVGKNELTYSAVHPINHVKEISTKQNVYIHGDIVFHKPADIPTGKVNTTLDPKTGVSATFDFVNDDGTITTKDVPVTSKDVTSDKVGYVDGKISAKVEVVAGLINSKNDTAKVAFNGLPYIDAANTIRYDGVIPSKTDIINKMLATAGMKLANGSVIDLTDKIDYSDVNRVILDKNGNYEIILTVKDQDGFITYTTVNVIVEIKVPEEPIIPVPPTPIPPINPTNPVVPSIPNNPQVPPRPNIPTPPQTPVEKDTAAAVSRDIPLSEAIKNGITDDFVKSYITASTENKGLVNFEVISHTVQPRVGEYEATIRLEDGTVLTVKLRVVDDSTKDVEQPEYGRDKDCIIHWIILLLFAGYSIYAIVAMLKRRKDNKDLEKALEEMEENELNAEGVEQDEN